MPIEWKPIEGGFSSVMETALAQSKQLTPQQINISQGFGSRFITPEEYYSSRINNSLGNNQQNPKEEIFKMENQNILNTNPTEINNIPKDITVKVTPSDKDGYREAMYNEFRAQGLNENQALGLLLNVEAENNFQNQYLFGTHQDSGKTAYGALSWQSGREKGLIANLTKAGLYRDGKIAQNTDSVRVMASYMVQELKSGTQGNYLNFKGNTPLDYAREANRTFTRSSRRPEILQGRERQYATALNWYNNRGKK